MNRARIIISIIAFAFFSYLSFLDATWQDFWAGSYTVVGWLYLLIAYGAWCGQRDELAPKIREELKEDGIKRYKSLPKEVQEWKTKLAEIQTSLALIDGKTQSITLVTERLHIVFEEGLNYSLEQVYEELKKDFELLEDEMAIKKPNHKEWTNLEQEIIYRINDL